MPLLLLSFGGPEGPEQVMPFLENVTRGRGIPPERLDDGRRALPAFRRRLADQRHQPRADRPDAAGRDRPAGLLRQPQLGAVRRGHGCDHARQRDSPGGGVRHVGVGRLLRLHAVQSRTSRGPAPAAGDGAPELVKLRQYFDHPLFVEMFADAIADGGADLPAELRGSAAGVHRAFDPAARADRVAARTSTPPGRLRVPRWSRRRRATPTTTRCGSRGRGRRRCRGWNPMSPTTSSALAERGTKAVIVCPIGFVADHIEVVWDLDHELRAAGAGAGHRVRAGGDAERRPPVRAAGRST